jgi:hypothetical protein
MNSAPVAARIDAHRAPDPVPDEEPMPDPFEDIPPHHPVHTPMNDDPLPDHNPSIFH